MSPYLSLTHLTLQDWSGVFCTTQWNQTTGIPTVPYNLPRLLIATNSLLFTPYRLITPLSTAEISIRPDWTEHQCYIHDNTCQLLNLQDAFCTSGWIQEMHRAFVLHFLSCWLISYIVTWKKSPAVLACTTSRWTLCKISWRLNSSKHSCHVWASGNSAVIDTRVYFKRWTHAKIIIIIKI